MSPENRQKLEKYRPQFENWKTSQYISLQAHEINEIVDVIHAEWDSGYSVLRWCGYCVGKMAEMVLSKLENESA